MPKKSCVYVRMLSCEPIKEWDERDKEFYQWLDAKQQPQNSIIPWILLDTMHIAIP